MASGWASGTNGPTGKARIRPDWVVIGLKFGFSLLLIYFVPVGRALIRTTRFMIGFVTNYVRNIVMELVMESKRQNKS